ncbi:MAG TPA: hypothetical protein VGS62_05835 [Streptosporangiaceae bacterium]|nr:hypothetical protein [Streptosporangiaceae bacterium]
MDSGSDPGRDDYGLPRVDVEIPDDARDLDRDVQAYYRELKAARRRRRARRLIGPLIRHGMVIPLVAGCLALSLLAGTLLTVFGARQLPRPAGMSTAMARQPSSTAKPSGESRGTAGHLPDAQVLVDGKPQPLLALVPALLAWVPSTCGCATTLKKLARQAVATHVAIYFVGTDGAEAQLPALASQAGQRSTQVVDDPGNVLASTYHLSGLAAIFAHSDGTVGSSDILRNPVPGPQTETRLRDLELTAVP